MPAPANADEFVDLIRKSGVVDDNRLNSYLKQLASNSGIPADVNKFASLLMRDGVLTFFQAEQFLLGKWKRFTIGKYKVLERLGSGGMGQVFLCEHKLMRRKVAVKVLPTAKAQDSSSLERFYREARAVAALDHPNIVRAYDIDQDDNLHFLVMEYVDGASLQEMVKKGGPMGYLRCCHYVYWSAIGLQHAHVGGLIHRDIKPANILVDRQGTVKILDMGLARFFNDDEDLLTRKYDENVLGTADYLAPEQALDSHTVDGRADIYSLGATFYFMLTGRPPFNEGTIAQKLIWHQTRNPEPIREIRPEVPEGVAAIIEKMMAKEPDQRFLSPAELADALEPWVLQTPIDPPPEREMPQLSAAAQSTGGGPATTVRQMQQVAARTAGSAEAKPIAPEPGSGAKKTAPSSGTGRGARPAQPVYTVSSGPAVSDSDQAKRRSAPAPIIEKLPTAETAVWEALAADTSDNARNNTDRQTKPARPQTTKPRVAPLELPPPRRIRKKPRVSVLALLIGALVVLALGISYAVYWYVIRTPAKQQTVGLPAAVALPDLTVSKPGGKGKFNSVKEALAKAKDGQKIVIFDSPWEESLTTAAGEGKGVVIEGDNSAKEIVWTLPRGQEDKIVLLRDPEGLTLRHLTFEGNGKALTGISITGKASGLLIDDVVIRGMKQQGIVFTDCEGSETSPVVVQKSRIVVQKGSYSNHGIMFKATEDKGSKQVPRRNESIMILDCRIEGPFMFGAFTFDGSANKIDLWKNRIFNSTDGVHFETAQPGDSFHILIRNNTFYKIRERGGAAIFFKNSGLLSQEQNRGNQSIELVQNYFALCDTIVRSADGFENFTFQPAPADNARNSNAREGAPRIVARPPVDAPNLPTNGDDDKTFLRYDKSSILYRWASGGKPVGAPPVD
jgi:eukaryotic-like serine/threonine-protein kinase